MSSSIQLTTVWALSDSVQMLSLIGGLLTLPLQVIFAVGWSGGVSGVVGGSFPPDWAGPPLLWAGFSPSEAIGVSALFETYSALEGRSNSGRGACIVGVAWRGSSPLSTALEGRSNSGWGACIVGVAWRGSGPLSSALLRNFLFLRYVDPSTSTT